MANRIITFLIVFALQNNKALRIAFSNLVSNVLNTFLEMSSKGLVIHEFHTRQVDLSWE